MYYTKFVDNKKIKVPLSFPPENVGRFVVETVPEDDLLPNIITPFINWTDMFKNVNEEFGERELQALNNGQCIDTKAANAIIKGTKVF